MDLSKQDGEDNMLLGRLRKGDEPAFRRIYQKYYRGLYRVALKYLRCRELAEDAVQDIFIKLWDNKRDLNRSGSLRGFLFTALKNHVLNMISHRKRALKRDIQYCYQQKIDHTLPENVVDISAYRAVYQSAVRQLPERRREVFQLREKEGLTNQEVAEYLNISIHTVKEHYRKALKFVSTYEEDHLSDKIGT
jgi:RNA polymerase sigma-70 factor (ECF subfamily)